MARLTDFGVAKARSRITSTQPGVYKGRIAYAAPEQLLAGESTDARADIFAAGVVMWTALTGERLFAGGGDEATVQRLLRMNIPAPSTRLARPPKCLDAVCLKALQRLPGRRYQSAREMAHELREVARAQGLLGDSSEVGDWVQSSFREELAARRAELRGRDDGTQRMRLEREDRIAAVSALPGIGARPVRPPPVPANTQIRPQTPPGPARCPEGPALRSVPPARTATLASFPERATRDHRRTTRRPSELSTSTSEDSAPMSPPWAALSRIQLRGRIWLVCVALAVGALAGGWLSWTALSVPSVTSVPPAPSVTSVPSALSAETNAIPPSAKTYAGTVSAPKRTPDEASSPNARAPAPATPDTAGAADVTQEGTGPALPGRPATTGSDVVPTSDPARSARRQARRVQRAKRRKLAIEARRQGLDDNPYLHTR